MLQTHTDFDQAESERLAHAIEQIDITQRRNERLERENDRLTNALKTIIKQTSCDDTWDYANRVLKGEKLELPYRFEGS